MLCRRGSYYIFIATSSPAFCKSTSELYSAPFRAYTTMRSIILSLAVSMAVAHQAVAFTYWIDGTCTGHRSMDATLAEVIAMGKGVDKRLNSASDTDFQHVWEYAMKRTKDTNDKVFKDVSGKNVFSHTTYSHYCFLTQT